MKIIKVKLKNKATHFQHQNSGHLLYKEELLRAMAVDMNKLDALNLQKVHQKDTENFLSSKVLYCQSNTLPPSVNKMIRRWRCLWHILRRDGNNLARIALTWAPEGKIRRGRTQMTWQKSVEKARDEIGWKSWRAGVTSARDREGCKAFLYGLRCPSEHDEDK